MKYPQKVGGPCWGDTLGMRSYVYHLTMKDIGVLFKNILIHFSNIRLYKQCEAYTTGMERLSEDVTTGLSNQEHYLASSLQSPDSLVAGKPGLLTPSAWDLSSLGPWSTDSEGAQVAEGALLLKGALKHLFCDSRRAR